MRKKLPRKKICLLNFKIESIHFYTSIFDWETKKIMC